MGKVWPMGHSLSTPGLKKQSGWARIVRKGLSIEITIDLDGWGTRGWGEAVQKTGPVWRPVRGDRGFSDQ